ncbi:TetR family transcriptional regulator [Halobacteriales archaeon QS_8_69_26]|nr:MAG: TetR family transcriptional regulator [Halobacteriales archaeon QS_8_69_26]
MPEETTSSSDAKEAFLAATYRALCAHGFAEVTMQDIADETERSKASLHYHFDGKADLFEQFLEHLYGEFEEMTADPPGDSPAERLIGMIRIVLSTDRSGDAPGFTTAFLEIKAQSPYREAFRERLTWFDDRARDRVRALVVEGIEAGEFPEETDPDAVASFVTTYMHGTWTRSVAAGSDVAAMREHLVEYVLGLLAEGATVDRSVGLPSEDPEGRESATEGAEGTTDVAGGVSE